MYIYNVYNVTLSTHNSYYGCIEIVYMQYTDYMFKGNVYYTLYNIRHTYNVFISLARHCGYSLFRERVDMLITCLKCNKNSNRVICEGSEIDRDNSFN